MRTVHQVLHEVERRHSHVRRATHNAFVCMDLVRQIGERHGVVRQLAPEHIVLIDVGFVLVQPQRAWHFQKLGARPRRRVERGSVVPTFDRSVAIDALSAQVSVPVRTTTIDRPELSRRCSEDADIPVFQIDALDLQPWNGVCVTQRDPADLRDLRDERW